MPRCAAGGTLSVPISKPRYTAVESQLTISPPYCSASASASALLPEAVGPRTASTRGRRAPESTDTSADAHPHVHHDTSQSDQESELLCPRDRQSGSSL